MPRAPMECGVSNAAFVFSFLSWHLAEWLVPARVRGRKAVSSHSTPKEPMECGGIYAAFVFSFLSWRLAEWSVPVQVRRRKAVSSHSTPKEQWSAADSTPLSLSCDAFGVAFAATRPRSATLGCRSTISLARRRRATGTVHHLRGGKILNRTGDAESLLHNK